MKKIILFIIYCAPLVSAESSRDRYYVDGYRRAAYEAGVTVGVLAFGMCNRLTQEPLTLVDGFAFMTMLGALTDMAVRYPGFDSDFERDHFMLIGEVDNRRECFETGFAAVTLTLPILKICERLCLGDSAIPTTSEGLSVIAGALAHKLKKRL